MRTRTLALAVVVFALACTPVAPRVKLPKRPVSLTFDRPSDLVPPEGMRVRATHARTVSLAWDPVLVGDVGGYVVMRSKSKTGKFKDVGRTDSRFETIYTDAGAMPGALGDGETYYYRVHPYDALGRVSRSHTFVKATTDPPPEPPIGIQAYSYLPRRVVLSWEPSPETTVVHYMVLRGPAEGGPWEEVATVDGRLNTVHEDAVSGDLFVMYYRLRAVNGFGGRSEPSDPVRAFTKAEPLPPLAPEVTQRRLGTIDLRWPRNVEPDVTLYEVSRARRPPNDGADGWTEETVVAEVPAPDTTFSDQDIGCGEPVRYRLRAKDDDGLVSGYSEPLEAVGQGIGLSVSRTGGKLELRWDPNKAEGYERVRIYSRRRLGPDRLLGEVTDDDHFPLLQLGSGPAHLVVLLDPTAAGDGDTAPPCELRVDVR